jgi:TorA maturation chaperone TorD
MDLSTEFATFMRGRVAFYKLFSTVFKEPPDTEGLAFIISGTEYFKALAEGSEITDLKNGSDLFYDTSKVVSEQILKNVDKVLTELNIAYSELFLLGSYSVRYTESSFLSKAGLWKQKEWEEVKEIYLRNNFAIPTTFNEPEDHIAIELLFMSALSNLTAQSIEKQDYEICLQSINAQTTFLQQHILKWIPNFCDKVVKKSVNVNTYLIYRALAMLLKGYLAYDYTVLDSLSKT